jgi:hypothetical protein
MNEANVMTIQIPMELKHRIEIIAEEQGVSLNQLAMYMFAKEVSSFEAGQRISSYWKGYTKQEIIEGFDNTMKKVKNREVPEWDKI